LTVLIVLGLGSIFCVLCVCFFSVEVKFIVALFYRYVFLCILPGNASPSPWIGTMNTGNSRM